MKKLISLVFFVILICFICYGNSEQSFIIEIGNQSNQIGFTYENGEASGPVSICGFKDEIYILDDGNLRVNVYSYQGTYKKSISIPKELGVYQDLTVNPQGEILLLTDNGIYRLGDKETEKIYDIPNSVSTPYYIQADKFGNLIFNGLSKPGKKKGITSGIFSNNSSFNELDGYIILTSFNGLIGLKQAKNVFLVLDHNKVINKLTLLSSKVLPIGLNDKKEIYCAEHTGKNYIFYKIDINGKKITKEKNFELNSALLGDESINLRSFRVTWQGDIICLDVNKERCRVLITRL